MRPETYLWRFLISIRALAGHADKAFLILIPGLLLAVLLGRAILETLTRLTGLTFFLSGFGVLVFYVLITVFSLLIAPVYAIWNLIRYELLPENRTVTEATI